MSVKAMSLTWDLECPKQYGKMMFKPSHKYVLVAYADHADHNGKNIWPAVPTIAKKTGLDDRTVQRLTGDLEAIGFLVEDGVGPRGTNKWYMPFSEGGDKLSPVTICLGDKNEKSLGDIPSGDIPSGDKLTPEFKEPEPILMGIWESLKFQMKDKNNVLPKAVEVAIPISLDDDVLTIAEPDEDTREWAEDRLTRMIERLLVGILNTSNPRVEFVVAITEAV